MNTQARYIKSFSKGQITIPKEIRDSIGIENEFWLKIYAQNGKIIAEPVEEKKMSNKEWRKWLLSVKTTWDLSDEIRRNRKALEKQIKSREL